MMAAWIIHNDRTLLSLFTVKHLGPSNQWQWAFGHTNTLQMRCVLSHLPGDSNKTAYLADSVSLAAFANLVCG